MCRIFLFSILICLALEFQQSAKASSIILDQPTSWSGWRLQISVESGFRQAGNPSGATVSDTKITNFTIAPGAHAPGSRVITSALSTFLPPTGHPQDVAQMSASLSYHIGSSIAEPDTFDINLNSWTIPSNSFADFGNGLEEADAYNKTSINLISSIFIPAGYTFHFPESLTLTDPSQESFEAIAIVRLPGGVHDLQRVTSGSNLSPVSLDNLETHPHPFDFGYDYEVVTPFGGNATNFSYSVSGSVIPEPGASLLIAITSSLLLFKRTKGSSAS